MGSVCFAPSVEWSESSGDSEVPRVSAGEFASEEVLLDIFFLMIFLGRNSKGN